MQRKKVATAIVAAFVGILACDKNVPAPASPETAASATSAPPRSIPPLETACTTDADCTVTGLELVDAAQTRACCPGCTNHAGSAAWKKSFDAACRASPPPMCPPIGCPMPIQTPACVAKTCALK
ncbi:MAG TPA: hypothetical protein VF316_21565 [Polyangiaceae bacterium]